MTAPIQIPGSLAETAARTWGEEGRAWAERLPAQVDELCQEWRLVLRPADYTFSYSFVVPVERETGEPAVLKLRVPTTDFQCELNALATYDGEGMCRLLASDAKRGAMLLERVNPGVPLLEVGETPESVSAAASVMRRLRKPPSPEHPLPALIDWWRSARDGLRERSGGGPGPFPPAFIEDTDAIYADLFAERAGHIALHGDLHHWNILSSDREGWIAIDPHGVTGPAECEIGAFMLNPNDGALVRPDVSAVLGRRLDQFADELGFDRETLRLASFAYAMLSITWSTEDGGDGWKPGLEIARALRDA
ncbi:MAG: aminoglycoside phosphotransferase family protein [Dehalococcoidia bacterium]